MKLLKILSYLFSGTTAFAVFFYFLLAGCNKRSLPVKAERQRYFTSPQIRASNTCSGDTCGTAIEYLPGRLAYVLVRPGGDTVIISELNITWYESKESKQAER